jgi:hypothetical protein
MVCRCVPGRVPPNFRAVAALDLARPRNLPPPGVALRQAEKLNQQNS